MEEGKWNFLCPRCGHSDQEKGRLASDEQIYCSKCLDESSPRRVRLNRWKYKDNVSIKTDEIFRASLSSTIRAAKEILFISIPQISELTSEEYWKKASENSRVLAIKQAIACFKIYQIIQWEGLKVIFEGGERSG